MVAVVVAVVDDDDVVDVVGVVVLDVLVVLVHSTERHQHTTYIIILSISHLELQPKTCLSRRLSFVM